MASLRIILTAAFVVLGLSSSEAIRCWTCSSDLDSRCHDTFNATIPYGGHTNSLTDCDRSPGPAYQPYVNSARSVCRKSKQYVNGEMTIIRSCAWQTQDEPVGPCSKSSSANQVRVVFCETCEYEGCNSGYSLSALPALAALGIPLSLMYHLH